MTALISAALGAAIALAYVQREFVEPGTALRVGGVPALVRPLPFVGRPA